MLFLATFAGGLAAVYLFVLLIDPYGVVPFSLPIERPIVSISQRHFFPQLVRSRRFDSLIVGSSTIRLLDPAALNAPFSARFVNLAMDSMTAWEQQVLVDFFQRRAGQPRVLVVSIDAVWCDPEADRHSVTPRGFPHWLYDDNPWNDHLYFLNSATVEVAARLVGYQLGLYKARVRNDGFEVFVPPESEYDLARARQHIWQGRGPQALPDLPPPPLAAAERNALSFPALAWLDAMLAKLPGTAVKVLAVMPVHVAAQAWPGTHAAAIEAECTARIIEIARARRATVIDWRIASPITRNDANYWDGLHYRLPIAERIARELAAAVLDGRPSHDGSYRLINWQAPARQNRGDRDGKDYGSSSVSQ